MSPRCLRSCADKILSDVYVKNLNAELENTMGDKALVTANKKLYSGVCSALAEAARILGVKNVLNLWVISSNINQKIPATDMHDALREGGADSVETDSFPHNISVEVMMVFCAAALKPICI